MRRAAVSLPLAAFALALAAGGAVAAQLPAPREAGVLAMVAHAVEGAESSWGADPRMWRPNPAAAQGPMQVTAAAASDVGGGNRFDPKENRILGQAYLADMYRRFGSWPDAVAAYNWGPGHMDSWIRSGRPVQKLPLGVARYQARVLLAAALPTAPPGLFFERLSWAPRIRRLGIVHVQPHGRSRYNPNDPVNRLYAEVMSASAAR